MEEYKLKSINCTVYTMQLQITGLQTFSLTGIFFRGVMIRYLTTNSHTENLMSSTSKSDKDFFSRTAQTSTGDLLPTDMKITSKAFKYFSQPHCAKINI